MPRARCADHRVRSHQLLVNYLPHVELAALRPRIAHSDHQRSLLLLAGTEPPHRQNSTGPDFVFNKLRIQRLLN